MTLAALPPTSQGACCGHRELASTVHEIKRWSGVVRKANISLEMQK